MPRGAINDGPGGKTGNIVGYGIVCVGIPIGDPAFVKRFLELKEEEIFDKIDRTVELLTESRAAKLDVALCPSVAYQGGVRLLLVCSRASARSRSCSASSP